jgi:hypothetical protein
VISDVPCPAHGTYINRDGQKKYYRSTSRVLCLMEYYDACSRCPHRDFQLLIVKTDQVVVCPVLTHYIEGTLPDDPVRTADVLHVERTTTGKIVDDQMTLQTCIDNPFQSCSGCTVRRTWLSSPKR